MAFGPDDLLLSPDKAAQLTKALSTLGVADPLRYLCDEAAADVSRMVTGYVLEPNSLRSFNRALALFRAYSKAGPVPPDVQRDYDSAMKELEAIAKGDRPNLPREQTGANPPAGQWGSDVNIPGRMKP